MSETIRCTRCLALMAWEDAERELVETRAAPWETIDEDNAPIYELLCAECSRATA